MATTPINSGNNSSKKEAVANAAKAGAAVAVGAVAGAASSGAFNGKENPEEQIIAQNNEQEQEEKKTEEQNTEEQPKTEETKTQQTEGDSNNTDGPQPITSGGTSGQQTTQGGSGQQNIPQEDPQNDPEHIDIIEEDPNVIAQEIISGEEIDPTDIDMENLVSFTNVGTIYGSDGQEYHSATMLDDNGNELTIVDIDNDNEFDLVLNDEGELIGEMPVSVNVSDAELGINSGEQTYLAQGETDIPTVDPSEMMQDIITT